MDYDRVKRAFAALVKQLMSRIDWLALYPCRVVTQAADGTLELQPDDPRMPGVTGVPIRLGLPGVTVRVQPGARVLLGFENGNPQLPMATLWESHGVAEISFDGGLASVARVGDRTVPHTHTGTAGPYPVVLSTEAPTIAEGAPRVKA